MQFCGTKRESIKGTPSGFNIAVNNNDMQKHTDEKKFRWEIIQPFQGC